MPQCRTNPLLSGRVRPQAIARSSFKSGSPGNVVKTEPMAQPIESLTPDTYYILW